MSEDFSGLVLLSGHRANVESAGFDTKGAREGSGQFSFSPGFDDDVLKVRRSNALKVRLGGFWLISSVGQTGWILGSHSDWKFGKAFGVVSA